MQDHCSSLQCNVNAKFPLLYDKDSRFIVSCTHNTASSRVDLDCKTLLTQWASYRTLGMASLRLSAMSPWQTNSNLSVVGTICAR